MSIEKKYSLIVPNRPYIIQTFGEHHHLDVSTSDDRRGLDRKQKGIVDEAFGMVMTSARDILSLE